MYWPNRYDFVSAFLLKLMSKPYEPEISPHFYFHHKQDKTPTFQRQLIHADVPIAPRMGCSCYEFMDRLFIFGGFYQQEMNYLELQHDVTAVDLQLYEQTGRTKLRLENLKSELYCRTTFGRKLEGRQKPNSFVRPRMEI